MSLPNMTMQPLDLDGFAAWLSRNDRRNSTIRKHLIALKHLHSHGVELTKEALEVFLVGLKNQGKKGSYLNSFVFAVALYGKYKNTDLRIKEFKREDSVKATLSDSEIDAFLALPRRSHQPAEHHKKFTMFWKIIADTGMRPGEVAVLKPMLFDWGRGVIIIETSKTNKGGQVPIPPNIANEIKEYLKGFQPNEYIFPSGNGGKTYSGAAVLDNVAWHFDWKKRITILGLNRPHLTPYSFRHTYGTRLLEEDVSLFHVKKLMRHRDLKSTLVYEHLTTKDLIKAQSKLPRIRRDVEPLSVLEYFTEMIKGFQFDNDIRFSEVFKKGLLDLIYEESRRLRALKAVIFLLIMSPILGGYFLM